MRERQGSITEAMAFLRGPFWLEGPALAVGRVPGNAAEAAERGKSVIDPLRSRI
jgi:hypothetical protein